METTPTPSVLDQRELDISRMPYQLPFPAEAADEVLVPSVIPEDERVWVPQAEGLHFRPLLLHASQGYWCNLLRVRRTGIVSRHRHPMPVTGYVIKGRWHYLEHDWMAEPGAFLYETEMITLFTVTAAMIYVDPWGKTTGFEDVFTKIEMCRKHYEAVGLGADYVDQFIR